MLCFLLVERTEVVEEAGYPLSCQEEEDEESGRVMSCHVKERKTKSHARSCQVKTRSRTIRLGLGEGEEGRGSAGS